MKKKFLLVTLTMVPCISAIGTLTACGEKHIHVYNETTTAPACTKTGLTEGKHLYLRNFYQI